MFTLQQCQDECARTADCFGINIGKNARAGECHLSSTDACCVGPHDDLDAYQKETADAEPCVEDVPVCPDACRLDITLCTARCKTAGCAGCPECPTCDPYVSVCQDCRWCGADKLLPGTVALAACRAACDARDDCHAINVGTAAATAGSCWLALSQECCAETAIAGMDVFQKITSATCLLDYPLVRDTVVRELQASQDTWLENTLVGRPESSTQQHIAITCCI